MECVVENDLSRFLEGGLDPKSRRELQEHFDLCAACRVLLAEVVRDDAQEALPRGTSLGRYVVMDRLGAGSMGVVYLAYDPELDRSVALKLLHPNGSSPPDAEQARWRVLREAQAMARLSHPNVIAIYDVGTVGDRVFLAMEYVVGRTLRRWLAAQDRDWQQIVAAFCAAGRGLAAAHQAGLVHRDFKPDNVLVGEDGRIRVLDLGLARPDQTAPGRESEAPAPWPATESLRTGAGAVVGTPAYMAPEQWQGSPSHRSDQFSFCVSLYEALYGERPKTTDDALTLGRPRRGVPRRVHAALLRGMRSDAAERFADMGALLSELERKPGAVWRRLAVSALVLAVMGGVVGLPSLSRRRAEQRCYADIGELASTPRAARNDAMWRSFERSGHPHADEVWGLVASAIDRYADEWTRAAVDLCEHDVHDLPQAVQAARIGCLRERRDALGELSEAFLQADGDVVRSALLATEALPAVSDCDDPHALGAWTLPDPQMAPAVEQLRSRMAAARTLLDLGKFGAGLDALEPLVRQARAVGFPPLEAEVRYWFGRGLAMQGRGDDAEVQLMEALWAAEATRHDTLVARTWIALVMAVGAVSGRSKQGRELARHAEAAIERVGNRPELAAELAYSLGWVFLEARRWQDAAVEFRRALELLERVYGPEHYRVANVLGSLGRALVETSALEALGVQERAVRLWSQLLGNHHLNVAMGTTEIARTLLRLGRYAEALEHSQRSIALFAELGGQHPAEAFAWLVRGQVEMELRRDHDAKRSLERAVRLVEALLGSDHRYLIEPLTAAGRLAARRGHTAEAVERFQRALAIARRGNSDGSMQATLVAELQRMSDP